MERKTYVCELCGESFGYKVGCTDHLHYDHDIPEKFVRVSDPANAEPEGY